MTAARRLELANCPIAQLPDPASVPLLRVDDLVGLIPLGRSAIYEAVKAGDIPSITIRGRIFIPTGELRRRWGVDATPPATPLHVHGGAA